MDPSTDAVVASLADELVPLDTVETADLAPVADALVSDDTHPPTDAHDGSADESPDDSSTDESSDGSTDGSSGDSSIDESSDGSTDGSSGDSSTDTPVVIGMGEASHGTREFFTFKTRLIRRLVEQRGVRLVAIEANVAAVLAVNDYVTDGAVPVGSSGISTDTGTDADTPDSAAAALDQNAIHSVYQTDAIRELVEWVRSYNENRSPAEQVRFHGVDMQIPMVVARRLRAFLDRVDPSLTDRLDAELERLADPEQANPDDTDLRRRRIETLKTVVSTLRDAFDANEASFVADSSRRAQDLARRLVWTLDRRRAQLHAVVDEDEPPLENIRVRDEAMAAQVEWLCEWTGVERVVLWGHNAHLARHGFRSTDAPSLGSTLAAADSLRYVAVGLTLGSGSVRSVYTPEMEFREYEMDTLSDESVPDLFSRVEHDAFFLDLRTLSDDSPLSAWLATEPSHLAIGGAYENSPVSTVEYDLREAFDALVFIRETTPARGLAE